MPPTKATEYLQQCYDEWVEASTGLKALKMALAVAQLRHDFAQLNLNEASAEWLDEYKAATRPEEVEKALELIDA